MTETLSNDHLKQFLENTPLYTWAEFGKPHVNRLSLLIRQVDVYCDVCKQLRPFLDIRSSGGAGRGHAVEELKSGETHLSFSCVSCMQQHIHYYLQQVVTEDTIQIQKFGELPRQRLPRNRDNRLTVRPFLRWFDR
jgi:hypothetical protein